MNEKIKAEWLKRLRSGDYTQGSRHLNRDGKFCCLGILGDIAVDEGVTEWHECPDGTVDVVTLYGLGDVSSTGILPDEVSEWAGLGGDRNPYCGEYPLTVWNDNRMFNFDQIADLIEKHL